MNICVIGWYGSETLGDRAILDGIIRILESPDCELKLSIGSLYPFFTERTIAEDEPLYRANGRKISVGCFDVYDKSQLHNQIKAADAVIMGGGPLMDLNELLIIRHAFKYARRHDRMTALFGCGYGPLHKPNFIRCVKDIAALSDVIIMRSEQCRDRLAALCDEERRKNVFASADPAMVSVMQYASENTGKNKKSTAWVMNIRDIDYVNATKEKYYTAIKNMVEQASQQTEELVLMPMHSFYIGGDDRYIQNRVRFDIWRDTLTVMQKPPTLMEAYDLITSAKGCIGMRYHSVVFQAYLNGNNYIIDYTAPKTGKISAFLNAYDTEGFYKKRYVNIYVQDAKLPALNVDSEDRFSYDPDSARRDIEYYKNVFNNIRY